MKKAVLLGITVLIFQLSKTSCVYSNGVANIASNSVVASESTHIDTRSPNANSGVEIIVNKIMPRDGISITLDNKTDSEYTYGEDYVLYIRENDSWEVVQPIIDNMVFESIGYVIAPQSKTDEIFIDWSWTYGELQGGDYLIRKELLLVRNPGDFDRFLLEAEFSIPNTLLRYPGPI